MNGKDTNGAAGSTAPQPKTGEASADAQAKPSADADQSPGASSSDSASAAAAAKKPLEKATFGAGCFWHVEQAFEWLPGVKSAVSGYAGGTVRNPSYEMVHSGMTGHAEVVQVTFDPSVISYEKLLRVFWTHHDPTQVNRQGPDVGTQYRSVIFYNSPEQREAALKSYRALVAARSFRRRIATQLVPLRAFYRAEQYHQDYYGGKSAAHRRVTGRSRSKTRRLHKPAPRGAEKPSAGAAASVQASKSKSKSASSASRSEVKSDH